MRIPRLTVLAAVSGLVLAGCASGDIALTEPDIARRAGGTWLVETATGRVLHGKSNTFRLSCLDGTRLAEGSAKVVNVTGPRPWDHLYNIDTKVDHGAGRVTSTITHTGTHDREAARYVVVEFRLRCVPPTPKA